MFQIPTDIQQYTMYTYIANDEEGNPRLRLYIVPHHKYAFMTLLSNLTKIY